MKKLFFGILVVMCGIISTFLVSNVTFAQKKVVKSEDVGINLTGTNNVSCLTEMGKGCFDYEKLIGIEHEQNKNITAMSIVQDVIQAATYMVGTVLSVVIIRCGLGYILATRDGKDPRKYGDGLKYAAIGALLVWGAYAIVRLIQYIAKG